jgi:prophage tail gpP-like protein
MKRLNILSEKKKVAAVVTEIGVPSLNRYRPKIVVKREELKAATEEEVRIAGEFSSSMH